MKVSELAERTGVTVATLKYYLRDGLLHPGALITTTSSAYDDTHVARVRLIRALVDSGGLSIAAVHGVIDTLDQPPATWPALLGAAHGALSKEGTRPTPRSPRTDALVRSQGWRVSSSSPVRQQLEHALDAASAGGVDLRDEELDRYAEACHGIAVLDVAAVPSTSPQVAVHRLVVGSVLLDPVLAALRRLALEEVGTRKWGRRRGASSKGRKNPGG